MLEVWELLGLGLLLAYWFTRLAVVGDADVGLAHVGVHGLAVAAHLVHECVETRIQVGDSLPEAGGPFVGEQVHRELPAVPGLAQQGGKQMFRCGNNYQDRPCDGAPAAKARTPGRAGSGHGPMS